MTRNTEGSPDKKAARGGSGKRSRPDGRKFQSDFSWNEVDDVQQEEESLLLPAKKQKKRKYRVEKIESTLTAQNPQADLYQRKAIKRKPSSALGDEFDLPSYGKHLDDGDDEFDIFLRRAEEAEKKEREPKLASKKDSKPAKKQAVTEPSAAESKKSASQTRREKTPAESKRSASRTKSPERGAPGPADTSAEKAAPKPTAAKPTAAKSIVPSTEKPADSVTPLLAAIRAKAAGKLRKFGFTDDAIRAMVPRKNSVEDAIALLVTLLDAKLKLTSEGEIAPEPKRAEPLEPKRAKVEQAEPEQTKPERAKPERIEPKRRDWTDWAELDDEDELEDEAAFEPAVPEPAVREPAKRPKREKKRDSDRRTERVEPRAERTESKSERPQRSEQVKPRESVTERKPSARPPRKEPLAEIAEPADAAASGSRPLSFGGIELSRLMLESLRDAAYLEPSPIQAGTIPRIFAGVDLLGQSKTGSGKTAAFMIPIIEQVESCEPGNDPVALVVVPTRELAVQIRDETVKLSRNREILTAACYGGKPIADQIKKMSGGVDIVIGTPGRLLDLTKRHALSFDHLRWVVIDEADRMLDIGFRPDIERILKMTPKNRQTLLFSATLPDPVVRLAARYMNEPETYDFSENEIASDTIEQYYMTVDRERKFDALVRLLEREKPTQAIVFCRTKRMVDKLGRGLTHAYQGSVAAIHGDLAQSQRDRIMRDFRAGTIQILVATDVVGRGIDVSGISHIINFDIPQFCDDYVHRVGRTGRMGREGVAFTLVTSQEGPELTRVEMRINRLLKRIELDGFEAFARPDDSADEEQPKEQKAVFGKAARRIRHAL